MLELRGVGYAYPSRGWVFRGATFAVAAGTVTSVLGPNGRGKTTLVRCAAGFLTPQEGSVRRAAPVGFVPQARGSTFAYSVREMVLMGRVRQVGLFAAPGRRDHTAADSALDRVGIGHLAARPFPALSGGEQQLVLVARAVASGSPALILDEPATGLDLRNQGRVLALIRSLADEGMAVLLTTHHPDHALFVSDAAVLLGGPTGVRCGPARELLTDIQLSELYGVPVCSVTLTEAGSPRRALVVRYEPVGDEDARATPVTPTRAPDRSAPGRR